MKKLFRNCEISSSYVFMYIDYLYCSNFKSVPLYACVRAIGKPHLQDIIYADSSLWITNSPQTA